MATTSNGNENREAVIETLDFYDDEQVDRAVCLAVLDALREHKRKGQYVVGWRDGKVVLVPLEEIVVPDVE
jgi:hypothetical protein